MNIPIEDITVLDISNLNNILDNHGVAIVPLTNISTHERDTCLEQTKFYSTANSILNENNQIAEPTMAEKIDPSKYKHRKAGDDAAGFIHQYATPIHHLIQENEILRDALKKIYNTDTLKFYPNRLRIARKFKNDADSLHIEGKDLFDISNDTIKIIPGEIAMIAGITGQRRFIFWNINDTDLNPLYKYWKDNGKKEFTKIDPEFMNKHYPNCRKIVNIDCSNTPHLILWRETTPHEIAHSPSLSAFISPIEQFNFTNVRMTNSFQPDCFKNISVHDTNLLTICYNMGGYEWPSGKKLYQFCHPRVYSHFIKKIKSRYITNSKFKMRMITCGQINQHEPNYKRQLEQRNIYIPNVAFNENMPNFVIDPLSFSDTLLKDYGFIL